MLGRHPRSTPTATRFPYPTLFRSAPTLTTCHSYEAFAKIYQDRTPAVYVGANDGMLHAFNAKMVLDSSTPPVAVPDTDAGKEMFAYVPRTVYPRSEEHTSELQSLMRHSYAVF